MVTGTLLRRQTQAGQLAGRAGCRPTARMLVVTQRHQEWAGEALLYENSGGALREKNRGLWWGICSSGQK